jgi:hypothetical protein
MPLRTLTISAAASGSQQSRNHQRTSDGTPERVVKNVALVTAQKSQAMMEA